jgi:hypothetical protein
MPRLFQVAAQTSKLPPVANRARLQIQPGALVGMRIQKISRVTGRLQLRIFRMAKRAAIRQIDLVVAHQAIRHLRHGCGHRIGIFKSPMARHARIRRIQQRPDFSAIAPQIRAFIDRRGNRRCNIAQLQMLGVAKFLERWWRRGRENPKSRSQKERYRTATVSSPCQKSWQAEARPTWCRKLLIRRRGAGAFACEPGVARLLTRAVREPMPVRFFHSLAYQPLYRMRQIFFPPSSETRMLPSGNCIIATGRPHTSRESGEIIQPVKNSCTGPLGFPSWNGRKPTS